MSLTQIAYDKFLLVTKRILKEDISKNLTTLREYRWQIIEAYNIYLQFAADNCLKVQPQNKQKFQDKLTSVRNKFEACLNSLGCSYILPPRKYEQVDPATIGEVSRVKDSTSQETTSSSEEIPSSSAASKAGSEIVHTPTPETEEKIIVRKQQEELERQFKAQAIEEQRRMEDLKRQQEELERQRLAELERQRLTEELERQRLAEVERQRLENQRIMAELEAQTKLLSIVNNQIKKPYSGDPLGLPTFLTGVNIAKRFANTEELKTDLVEFVKGRLEGRAREFITDSIATIEELIATLQQHIKPENSKIIEGRIAALRYTYAKQQEFADKAEELADALRRTLILEGMTPDKANEMTVDRTVTLCRKSTQSDVVKAVLTAATFATPKEVVAKLITCSDDCVKERQVLHFNKNGNRNGQQRGRISRGRGYQNYNNQRGRPQQGNYNNYNNYNNNNSYRSRGSYRGRGNFGGRRFYSNNRYQGQPQNGGWQINRQQNVRLTQSGNASVPQALMGGPQIRQIE